MSLNYKRSYQLSPVCLYRTDARTGKFLEANKSCLEFFGINSLEDIQSRFESDFYSPEQRQRLIDRIRVSNKAVSIEIELKLPNGQNKYAIMTACFSGNGKYLEGSITDISGIKDSQITTLRNIREEATAKIKTYRAALH